MYHWLEALTALYFNANPLKYAFDSIKSTKTLTCSKLRAHLARTIKRINPSNGGDINNHRGDTISAVTRLIRRVRCGGVCACVCVIFIHRIITRRKDGSSLHNRVSGSRWFVARVHETLTLMPPRLPPSALPLRRAHLSCEASATK